jgi:nucleoside-diphosphate kinase
MNLVHASDGPESAQREQDLYFAAGEICSYEPTLSAWLKAADE